MYLIGDSVAELYGQLRDALQFAPTVSPHGQETKELMPLYIRLNDPRNRFAHHHLRNYNVTFAFCEWLTLLMPVKDLKYFTWANRNMKEFSDDGTTMHGAYGYRIDSLIPELID